MEEIEKIISIWPINYKGRTYLRIISGEEIILYEIDPINFIKSLLEAYRESLN